MANRGRSVQKRDEVEGVVRKIMEAYKSGPAEERKKEQSSSKNSFEI